MRVEERAVGALTESIRFHSARIAALADRRTVWVCRLLERGHTYAEIGRMMGITPQAVRKIASRSVG